MRLTRKMTECILVTFCLFVLVSCSHQKTRKTAQSANELYFNLDSISELTISYDEENVTFFKSDSNELVIKEYMTANKSSYYAKVVEKNDSIHISEGGKPLFKGGFVRYVEVYLPSSYHNALTVTTTDGDIIMSGVNLELSALRTDSSAGTTQISNAVATDIHLSTTSGSMDLGMLQADNIKLDSTSGSVECGEIDGNVTYTSTSGSLEVKSAIGSGSYTASNSGKLQVTYDEVTGDVSLLNKNDDVILALPAGLEFEFSATTKNGSVNTNFQQSLTTHDRTISGAIGSQPTVGVTVQTTNGNIEVTQ